MFDAQDMGKLIKAVIGRHDAIKAHLSQAALRLAAKANDIGSINSEYHDAITEALITYFEGGSVSGPRNKFRREMAQAFGDAMDLGTVNGGGELPFVDEALTWYNNRVEEEMGHIDELFQQAKDLRKDDTFDYAAWANDRADGYTGSVMAVYNAAVMFAKGDQMLTWNLGATEKHCDTCRKLDGKKHRASWYIDHNYIPRQPGADMECGGYNCDCSLTDKNGDEVTL